MLYYYLFRLLLNDSQNSISKADVLFLLTNYPKKVAHNNICYLIQFLWIRDLRVAWLGDPCLRFSHEVAVKMVSGATVIFGLMGLEDWLLRCLPHMPPGWCWLLAGGLSPLPCRALQKTACVSSQHGSWLSANWVVQEAAKQKPQYLLTPGFGRHTPPFLLYPVGYIGQCGKELYRAWILEVRIVVGHLGGWPLQQMLFQGQCLSEFPKVEQPHVPLFIFFSNLFLLLHSLIYFQSSNLGICKTPYPQTSLSSSLLNLFQISC